MFSCYLLSVRSFWFDTNRVSAFATNLRVDLAASLSVSAFGAIQKQFRSRASPHCDRVRLGATDVDVVAFAGVQRESKV